MKVWSVEVGQQWLIQAENRTPKHILVLPTKNVNMCSIVAYRQTYYPTRAAGIAKNPFHKLLSALTPRFRFLGTDILQSCEDRTQMS